MSMNKDRLERLNKGIELILKTKETLTVVMDENLCLTELSSIGVIPAEAGI